MSNEEEAQEEKEGCQKWDSMFKTSSLKNNLYSSIVDGYR